MSLKIFVEISEGVRIKFPSVLVNKPYSSVYYLRGLTPCHL